VVHLLGIINELDHGLAARVILKEEKNATYAWKAKVYNIGRSLKGEKVLMFAHICPGKFERYYRPPGFHWFRPDFNDLFIDEVAIL
jgi:hypothetical protein